VLGGDLSEALRSNCVGPFLRRIPNENRPWFNK